MSIANEVSRNSKPQRGEMNGNSDAMMCGPMAEYFSPLGLELNQGAEQL